MQTELLFILCKEYDFEKEGQRVKGISCRAFDPVAKQIVKVKTDKVLDYEFGAPFTVNVVLSGNSVDYVVTA